MEIKGKITKILDKVSGEGRNGEWEKITFVVTNNEGYEGREQFFAFDIFGADKVEEFNKYNSVGKEVEVSFNIRCKEYQGKYFTSLGAWKVFGASQDSTQQTETVEENNDLPF